MLGIAETNMKKSQSFWQIFADLVHCPATESPSYIWGILHFMYQSHKVKMLDAPIPAFITTGMQVFGLALPIRGTHAGHGFHSWRGNEGTAADFIPMRLVGTVTEKATPGVQR